MHGIMIDKCEDRKIVSQQEAYRKLPDDERRRK